MKTFDIVLLSTDKYMPSETQNPLATNCILENELVAKALRQEGLTVGIISWLDSDFEWESTSYVLLRTPWDYFERFEEFSDWFQATTEKTVFINSWELVEWNMDKNYLKDLAAKGIHLPNTYFIPKNCSYSLQEAMVLAENQFEKECPTWVLKPCVAAGAFNTYKFNKEEVGAYEERFKILVTEGDFMLQEFQHSILEKGEVSLMLFNGEFTHAVLKLPKMGDFRVQDDYGGSVENYDASQEEVSLAKQVVKAAPEVTDYARVDIFEDNQGELALAELEIFEPELWFRLKPEAAEVMAKQLKKRYF